MLKQFDQMLADNIGNKLTQALAFGLLRNFEKVIAAGLAEHRETVRKEFQDELDAKAAAAQGAAEVD